MVFYGNFNQVHNQTVSVISSLECTHIFRLHECKLESFTVWYQVLICLRPVCLLFNWHISYLYFLLL